MPYLLADRGLQAIWNAAICRPCARRLYRRPDVEIACRRRRTGGSSGRQVHGRPGDRLGQYAARPQAAQPGAVPGKYGHLRPGTYDIRLPRYDECPERYFSESVSESRDDDVAPPPDFALSLSQMRGIDDLLRKHELDMDVVSLFEFLQAGIQKREHAKFIFTRSLSDALSLLTEYGGRYGLSREDMSFFDASLIKDLYTSSGDAETLLHNQSPKDARYAGNAVVLCRRP